MLFNQMLLIWYFTMISLSLFSVVQKLDNYLNGEFPFMCVVVVVVVVVVVYQV